MSGRNESSRPLVTPDVADAPRGDSTASGPPAAPGAEESMTAPTPRPGSAVPGADTTMTGTSAPYGPPSEVFGGPAEPPPGAARPSAENTAGKAAEKTVADVLEPKTPEPRTAVVRRADEPSPSSETASPPLIPDAIIPPGMAPEDPPEPEPEPETNATRPTPRLGPGDVPPEGPGDPARGSRPYGGVGPLGVNKALLIGGSVLAALMVSGGGVFAYTTLSDDSPAPHRAAAPHRSAPPPPAYTPPAPTPTPSPTASARHKHKKVPVDIRDEKKDPKPLTVGETFPHDKVKVAGHTFVIAKTVLNNHCEFTANKPLSTALTQQHCRTVVRATLVSGDKKLAVTAGIAAMPTDAAAIAALKEQDPDHYGAFRGMKATGAPKLDGPGGLAATTHRGRYICYAYAAYADGHKAKSDDKTLKAVADGFRDAMTDPIDERAKSRRSV